MENRKKSNTKLLYFIPLVLQLIIHIVASAFSYGATANITMRILRAALVTFFSMLMGEGYGSIAFIVAGFCNRIGAYAVVIFLSIIGAGANLVGYMFSGVEGLDCIWMTLLFLCIDIFLCVFSTIRINQISAKKKKG